jgi:hypothetical protein
MGVTSSLLILQIRCTFLYSCFLVFIQIEILAGGVEIKRVDSSFKNQMNKIPLSNILKQALTMLVIIPIIFSVFWKLNNIHKPLLIPIQISHFHPSLSSPPTTLQPPYPPPSETQPPSREPHHQYHQTSTNTAFRHQPPRKMSHDPIHDFLHRVFIGKKSAKKEADEEAEDRRKEKEDYQRYGPYYVSRLGRRNSMTDPNYQSLGLGHHPIPRPGLQHAYTTPGQFGVPGGLGGARRQPQQ